MSDLNQLRSVWLVARRELFLGARAKSVILGLGAVVIILVGYLLLQQNAFNRNNDVTVGLTGQALALAEPLRSTAAQLGDTVHIVEVPELTDGVAEVRSGALDVLVFGAPGALHVTVQNHLDQRLRAALNGLVQQQVLDAELAEAGLRPGDVHAAVNQAHIQVNQLFPDDSSHEQRLAWALAALLLVTISLILVGYALARGIAEEKSVRVIDRLLAVASPGRLLLGKACGIGMVGLLAVLLVGLCGVLLASLLGILSAPSVGWEALGIGVLWYVIGFIFYMMIFALLGAFAAHQREFRAMMSAIVAVIVLTLVIGVGLLAVDSAGTVAEVLSMLPPFALVFMPGRMVLDIAPLWQVFLAIAVTIAVGAVLARTGGKNYRNYLASQRQSDIALDILSD